MTENDSQNVKVKYVVKRTQNDDQNDSQVKVKYVIKRTQNGLRTITRLFFPGKSPIDLIGGPRTVAVGDRLEQLLDLAYRIGKEQK